MAGVLGQASMFDNKCSSVLWPDSGVQYGTTTLSEVT